MRFHSGKILFLMITIALLSVILFTILFTINTASEDPEYHPYDEVIADMETVAEDHPDFVQLVNLSQEYDAPLTYQNHSLLAMRITDQDGDETEPAVLLTSVHHAREWITVEVTMHFLHYLVDNYGIDPYVTYLIDNRDIWIIPIVNPDGYLKSWEQNDRDKNWTGWRKNCRDNNEDGVLDNNDGVDLNRNYGYNWGYDEQGSSGSQSSTTYRGPSPFSEPETKAIETICNIIDFSIVIHYHSHGNLVLYPWAYGKEDTPDHAIFVMLGKEMAGYNGYTHGNTKDGIIYKCNGEANDWHYGVRGSYAFTIELGYDNEGYIPDESRIIPICEENLPVNLFACFAADNPGSLMSFVNPENTTESIELWNHTGPGDGWELVDDGLIGGDCWYMIVQDQQETSAELMLNLSLNVTMGETYLSFWEKYVLTGGSDAGVYLKDKGGNYTRIFEMEKESSGRTLSAGDRGDSGTVSGWVQVSYNLTPYLTEEPQWLTFIIDSEQEKAGDEWFVDGLRIASSPPMETLSRGEDPEEYAFSVSPESHDLDLLPDIQHVVTVDITNEAQENNTIDISAESEEGWEIIFTLGAMEVDHVELKQGEMVTVNITLTIPSQLDAGTSNNYSLTFRSRENTSQIRTQEINVTVKAFYHITLDDPGDKHFLPGEEDWIELNVYNLGNTQIEIRPEISVTSGDDEGWLFSLPDNPTTDSYSDTILSISITPPDRIEPDEGITVRVDVSVVGHGTGDGSDSQLFDLVIDEVVEAGFGTLDGPTAKPGEDNEFSVRLYNHGNTMKEFTISVESDWGASLSKNTRNVDSYSSVSLTLTLIPPTDITAGYTEIVTLNVDSPLQNSTNIVFTSTAFYQLEISANELNHTIPAGRGKDIILRVYNRGNAINHISLTHSDIDGFVFEFTKGILEIPAFSSTTTKLTITISSSKPYDQKNIIAITATSDDDMTQEETEALEITVGKSYEVQLSLDTEDRKKVIAPKETAEYGITLSNEGNAQANIAISLENVPSGWTAVLDETEISLGSDRNRLVRLSVTSSARAKNKEEAKITVKAETGDDEFGYISDEITVTAVVTADESEGLSTSLIIIAVGSVLLLIIAGGFLFMNQRKEARAAASSFLGAGRPTDNASGSTTMGEKGLGERSITKASRPSTQNVSCPKCSSKFDVELPQSDKKTVKTMCIECGEIFAFEREVPEKEPVSAPHTQNVSCPGCKAKFDVELPPGDRKTVKTMCIECGEIFSFDRDEEKKAEGTPSAKKTQNVTCPECKSIFDVELPSGDKDTIKTMCIECGSIFSFQREDGNGLTGEEISGGPERLSGTKEEDEEVREKKVEPGPTGNGKRLPETLVEKEPADIKTSIPVKTGEVKEVPKTLVSTSTKGEEQSSAVEIPKVMKCPKCARKVFLKGREEKVKCIFCGTRIQIERRKKGEPA